MLKSKNRLKTVKLNNPKTLSAPQFILKISGNNAGVSRFAFIISKKIDKRAVVRNSLRRKISSSVEEIFDKIKTGNDFVFYPKSSAIKLEREDLSREIRNIFSKGNLLND